MYLNFFFILIILWNIENERKTKLRRYGGHRGTQLNAKPNKKVKKGRGVLISSSQHHFINLKNMNGPYLW